MSEAAILEGLSKSKLAVELNDRNVACSRRP
jgi:hypothetical protein